MDHALERKLLESIRAESIDQMFEYLMEAEDERLVIGSSTDGWIFSAAISYLEEVGILRRHGSEEGENAFDQSEFFQLVLLAGQIPPLSRALESLNPTTDSRIQETIDRFIRSINSGGRYGDYLFEAAKDDYIECIEGFRDVLAAASKVHHGLVVLIPF